MGGILRSFDPEDMERDYSFFGIEKQRKYMILLEGVHLSVDLRTVLWGRRSKTTVLRLVHFKIWIYHGRVGAGRFAAGRRGEAGSGWTGCWRVGRPLASIALQGFLSIEATFLNVCSETWMTTFSFIQTDGETQQAVDHKRPSEST